MHDSRPGSVFPAVTRSLPSMLRTPLGALRMERLLGKGKSGYSYLALLNGRRVVCKEMHGEACAYYRFDDEKTALEERDYQRLHALGLAIPRLIHVDHERGFLVKEFIDGDVASRHIAGGLPSHHVISQLFAMAHACRSAGLNIDFFPTNFVLRGSTLYYVDYETNPFDPAWSLERWGLYYWANTAGMRALVESGSSTLLNRGPASGVPLTGPFEHIVQSWIEEHAERRESRTAHAATAT